MFARSSILKHPSGITVRTPLLVPSFSSKGFRYDRSGRSEIRKILSNTAVFLTESILVSAYDIRYRHLPSPENFPCTPKITFVDSGGYEAGADHDMSTVYKYRHKTEKWTEKKYAEILDAWPDRIPAVFVSFDKSNHGKKVSNQIKAAHKLLSRYPRHLHAFLLKPGWRRQGSIAQTVNHVQFPAKALEAFEVVGVTEKELGSTMLDRMETVAALRRKLDDANVAASIQVFGALDPLSSCLYFLAGAEIFDGLTWLRFAYVNGACVYDHNYGITKIGLVADDDFVKSTMFSENYGALMNLQLALRTFASNKDFSELAPHAKCLKSAAAALDAKV